MSRTAPHRPPASPNSPPAPREFHQLDTAVRAMLGDDFSVALRTTIANFVALAGPHIGAAVVRTMWRDARPYVRAWRAANNAGDAKQAEIARRQLLTLMWNGGAQ